MRYLTTLCPLLMLLNNKWDEIIMHLV